MVPTMDILSGEGLDFFSFFPAFTSMSALLIMLVSSLGWGLGYFGQPHILVKFMAIGDADDLKKSTHIAMLWVLLSLGFAIAIGIVGKAYLSTLWKMRMLKEYSSSWQSLFRHHLLQESSGQPFWQQS